MFELHEKQLTKKIENILPDFVNAVKSAAKEESKKQIIIHQDAFSADYDEYELLGMAIKYAGLYGVSITIQGLNRETLSTKEDVELVELLKKEISHLHVNMRATNALKLRRKGKIKTLYDLVKMTNAEFDKVPYLIKTHRKQIIGELERLGLSIGMDLSKVQHLL
jgi:DNA-directed RNA polymerase alpha subunit